MVTNSGSCSSARLRPPPDRRDRPSPGPVPASASARPRRTVSAATRSPRPPPRHPPAPTRPPPRPATTTLELRQKGRITAYRRAKVSQIRHSTTVAPNSQNDVISLPTLSCLGGSHVSEAADYMCGSVYSSTAVPMSSSTPGRGRCQRAKRSNTSDGGGVSTAGRRGTPGAQPSAALGAGACARLVFAPGSPKWAPSGRCGRVRDRGSTTGRKFVAGCSSGVRRAARGFFARQRLGCRAAMGKLSAVACPSGLRSTPRKRVTGKTVRGFKSLRHRHIYQREFAGKLLFVCLLGSAVSTAWPHFGHIFA